MIQSVKEEREFLQGVQEDLREDRRHNPVPSIYGVWDIRLEETGRGNHQYVRYLETSDVIGEPEEVTVEQVLEDLSFVQIHRLIDQGVLSLEPEGYGIEKPYAFHDYIMEHTPVKVCYLREVLTLKPDLLFLSQAEGEAYLRDHKKELTSKAKVAPISLQDSPRFLHLLELLSSLDLSACALRFRTSENTSDWISNVDLFNALSVYIYTQMPKADHRRKWDVVNSLRHYIQEYAIRQDTGSRQGELYQKSSVIALANRWRVGSHPQFDPFRFVT